MCYLRNLFLVIFSLHLILSTDTSEEATQRCNGVKSMFAHHLQTSGYTLRRVNPVNGTNSVDCLNYNNASSKPSPCRTLHYALHESEDVIVRDSIQQDLEVHLAPGVYKFPNQTTRINNSQRIAIFGSDIGESIIVCGVNGSEEVPCFYRNFQITDSSNVLISGITFTGCGPITSPLYVASSDLIFINNCTFQNNISPSVLLYNSSNIMVTNSSFLDNHPSNLNKTVVTNQCYFNPNSDDIFHFFLSNRPTSGGISLYVDDYTTNILIEDCTFMNNTARPDYTSGLVRRSSSYDHGGALNIRLIDSNSSTVCISSSRFIDNSAAAHAGALAITMAGSSTDTLFIVSNSLFEHNQCFIEKCTGGAVGIKFFDKTKNTVLFLNSNFTSNEAISGGAMALSTHAKYQGGKSDILNLTNCRFISNRGYFEGTALGVFSITRANEIGVSVNIEDCHFFLNNGKGGTVDTSAMTVYRILASFYGRTEFSRNQGGGVTLFSSRMDVRGEVILDHNTAIFGAGLALSGRSLILLSENSKLKFTNNFVNELGAGLYVEHTSSDFILSVLNTGCFIRYETTLIDLSPKKWNNTEVTFVNNTAGIAGAAIYANDMSRCTWLGGSRGNYTIFQLPPEESSFLFVNNHISEADVSNSSLATDPTNIYAKTEYTDVSYGENITFNLSSKDTLENFREAVWSLDAPAVQQPLGSLSNENTSFTYTVPDASVLNSSDYMNNSASFDVRFSLLRNEADPASQKLSLVKDSCHPGYVLRENKTCICNISQREITRCDSDNRYFYAKDGLWVMVDDNTTLHFTNTIPGFLNCSHRRLGSLPGCLFKYDSVDEQCADGREGTLCGDCKKGTGVTFDLRYCKDSKDHCIFGKILFTVICVVTLIFSLLVLYFDFPIPNELRGIIFYAQVVGVIFRSTPYLITDNGPVPIPTGLDIIINALGFAMPFPLCFHEGVPAVAVALLGYIPPVLAILTAIVYVLCANRVKKLSHRETYGFHGFYFLLLFVYKYVVDTSFIFVSCTKLGERDYVFLYQGTQNCAEFPFILMVVIASILLILLAIVLPIYILKLIYAPQLIHVSNTLTYGLKNERRYLWYGVWDIWRRLLFVAASLFISVTTRTVVLFIHCLLIILCLFVLCIFKPYQKYYINVVEGLLILCLLGTTLSIYDDDDVYYGRKSTIISLSIAMAFAFFFVTYYILRAILKYSWPRMDRKWNLSKKLKPFQERCACLVNRMECKPPSIMEEEAGEPTEGGDEVSLNTFEPVHNRRDWNRDPYAPELRESLLED